MAPPKIPTLDDYRSFDGAHCGHIWANLSESWRCPGCDRTKFEVLRWTRRIPPRRIPPAETEPYMGWLAAFHRHHDHGFDGDPLFGTPARFEEVIVCDHCNSADGTVKRKLGLPKAWSFSPQEIAEFVTARPHEGHRIDYVRAREVYLRSCDLVTTNLDTEGVVVARRTRPIGTALRRLDDLTPG